MSNKWTEEAVTQLTNAVEGETPVSLETVANLAAEMDRSTNSVASKLRHMGIEVERKSDRGPAFSEEQSQELTNFLESNSGQYTYGELAEQLFGGAFGPRQIQGKVLALELTSHVRRTPPKEVQRKYSEEEEAQLIELIRSGAYLEEIAERMGREPNSIRGKALSLRNQDDTLTLPPQRDRVEQKQDAFEALGAGISEMTVEQIAEETGKTPRGVKSALTHRGIKVADYDGAAKRAKRDAA